MKHSWQCCTGCDAAGDADDALLKVLHRLWCCREYSWMLTFLCCTGYHDVSEGGTRVANYEMKMSLGSQLKVAKCENIIYNYIWRIAIKIENILISLSLSVKIYPTRQYKSLCIAAKSLNWKSGWYHWQSLPSLFVLLLGEVAKLFVSSVFLPVVINSQAYRFIDRHIFLWYWIFN